LFLRLILIHLGAALVRRNKLFYICWLTIRSWRKHISIGWRWRILVLFFIIHHLWKVKAFNFIFLSNWPVGTLLFDTRQRSLRTYRNLKILESKVSLNNSLHSSHIWIGINMKSFDKLAHMVRALPLLNSLKEAKVNNQQGGSSTYPWTTMQIYS
jgi:hypothetical protein